MLLLAHTNRISSTSTRDRMGATGALRQKARMLIFASLNPEPGPAVCRAGKGQRDQAPNAHTYSIEVTQVSPTRTC